MKPDSFLQPESSLYSRRILRTFVLTAAYDGTNFQGWQTQRAHRAGAGRPRTVQETIELALGKILQEKITVAAAGRTDAGVHAAAQTAHFRTSATLSPARLQKALNAILPEDIVVRSVRRTKKEFHARFDAKWKMYRYTIYNRRERPLFERRFVWHVPVPLDLKRMAAEARVLAGTHDFSSFQAGDKRRRGSIRTIKSIRIRGRSGRVEIDIIADGFLYNMVRNIAGTLVECGRGKFPAGSIRKILRGKNRRLAGPTAPAKGLCLKKVWYCA